MLLTILFIGSLWGFFESTLGGLLHIANFPFSGALMAPIGFAIMNYGRQNGLKAVHLPLTALIAASFKLADCFLFNLPLSHIFILNPMQAIIFQGICFAVSVSFLQGNFYPSIFAVTTSTLSFNFISFLAFGTKFTPLIENPVQTLLINMPSSTIITTAFLITLNKRAVFSNFSPALKISASASAFVLSMIIRGMFV